MGVYKKIDLRMWGDKKFKRLSPLPPCGQALWIYLISGPYAGNIPGLVQAGHAALAESLGWEPKAFEEAFREVLREGLIEESQEDRLIWVKNAIKYNPPGSPNVIRSWSTALDYLPECKLLQRALKCIENQIYALDVNGDGFRKAFDEVFYHIFGESFSYPSFVEGNKESLLEGKTAALPEAMSEALPEALPEAMSEALPEALPEAMSEALPEAMSKPLSLSLSLDKALKERGEREDAREKKREDEHPLSSAPRLEPKPEPEPERRPTPDDPPPPDPNSEPDTYTREDLVALANELTTEWYKERFRRTGVTLQPSSEDRVAAINAVDRLKCNRPLALSTIKVYWENWNNQYFSVKSGHMKKPIAMRQPEYKFRSYLGNIDLCFPPPPPPPPDPEAEKREADRIALMRRFGFAGGATMAKLEEEEREERNAK